MRSRCWRGCPIKLSEVTILVVDDEPALRDIFAKWLKAVGCGRVLTAADGAAALEVVKDEQVDLLITDVRMPVMDGVMLVRSLAKLDKPIPSIVFVSGFGDVNRKEMYGLGVEAFVSKPFDRSEVLGVLERAVSRRSRLWLTPMTIVPRQRFTLEAGGAGAAGANASIQLGRGGFSARYSGVLSLSKVNFRCNFAAKERELTGHGYVRWNSRDDQTVGIEFSYLDESCRSWVLEEIEANNPRSFIPDF